MLGVRVCAIIGSEGLGLLRRLSASFRCCVRPEDFGPNHSASLISSDSEQQRISLKSEQHQLFELITDQQPADFLYGFGRFPLDRSYCYIISSSQPHLQFECFRHRNYLRTRQNLIFCTQKKVSWTEFRWENYARIGNDSARCRRGRIAAESRLQYICMLLRLD